MKSTLICLIFSLLSAGLYAKSADLGVVHHPQPTEPIFVSPKLYNMIKKRIHPVPSPKSKEQRKDEELILKLQARRTPQDCADALNEVKVSLDSFFVGKDMLTKEEADKLTSFFDQIRNDADYFVQKLKVDFPRDRPFQYIAKVEPCVPKEVTKSYPSGHAVLSQIYARALTSLFPERQGAFETRADKIAMHRVEVGMHHPSDIQEGKRLGEYIYKNFQASAKYREALEKSKAGLKAKAG